MLEAGRVHRGKDSCMLFLYLYSFHSICTVDYSQIQPVGHGSASTAQNTFRILCHCIHLSSYFTCKCCNLKISHLNERQHRTCYRKRWVEYPSITLALPWGLGGMYLDTLKPLVFYPQKMQKWSWAWNKKQQRVIDLQDGSCFFFRQASQIFAAICQGMARPICQSTPKLWSWYYNLSVITSHQERNSNYSKNKLTRLSPYLNVSCHRWVSLDSIACFTWEQSTRRRNCTIKEVCFLPFTVDQVLIHSTQKYIPMRTILCIVQTLPNVKNFVLKWEMGHTSGQILSKLYPYYPWGHAELNNK